MRKSSGQNRHACAPYTRVPPPTVNALPFHSGSVGQHRVVADEPRVALRRRIDLALEPGPHARAAQVVAREVGAPQRLAALDEQHARPGLREHARRDAAARARADHDRRRSPRRARSGAIGAGATPGAGGQLAPGGMSR